MIINNNLQAVAGAYSVTTRPANGISRKTSSSMSAASEFSISEQGQSFSSMLRKLHSGADDVRADRVASLEKQIAAGTYNVSGSDIAASMLAMRW